MEVLQTSALPLGYGTGKRELGTARPASLATKRGDHFVVTTCFQTRAGNRARTGDLNLGKVALYQLSYARKSPQLTSPSSEATEHAKRAKN
jgi:hypothetical protein